MGSIRGAVRGGGVNEIMMIPRVTGGPDMFTSTLGSHDANRFPHTLCWWLCSAWTVRYNSDCFIRIFPSILWLHMYVYDDYNGTCQSDMEWLSWLLQAWWGVCLWTITSALTLCSLQVIHTICFVEQLAFQNFSLNVELITIKSDGPLAWSTHLLLAKATGAPGLCSRTWMFIFLPVFRFALLINYFIALK